MEAAEGFADHANLALDLTDVLLAVGEAANERRRGVILLFHEVQFLTKQQLEALIEALHKRAYMRAMAEIGPDAQQASYVEDASGRTSKNLATTRASPGSLAAN